MKKTINDQKGLYARKNNFFFRNSGKEVYIITLEKKNNYNILVEFSPDHKNFKTIKNIGYFLNKYNKTWDWLSDKANISEASMKTYFSGKEYITLRSMEKIVLAFNGVIKSPRELMNLDYPTLKGGKDFKLNICDIMVKYRINRGDLSLATGIDNGTITRYFYGLQKSIRIETLTKFFDFFKSRGVPLNYKSDLIYFHEHGESPLHFIKIENYKNLFPK